MPVTDSPLRYPGGKSQLTPLVVEVLRENNLFYGHYAEPFAGGAGIACSLLLSGYVSHVHINDLDPALYAFWWAVVYGSDRLCKLIDGTQVTIEEWHRQRAVQSLKGVDPVDLGFSTFFLNRTNRSGIILGGVIGGLEQNGAYPIDCRFNKKNLIRKIERIALHADRISVTNLDALVFLRKLDGNSDPRRTLVNIDPPYFVRGPELYRNWFTEKNHADLAKAIGRVKPFWMLTYDDTAKTQAFYAGYPTFRNTLRYTAQVKRTGVELLVFDPRLRVPAGVLGGCSVTRESRKLRRVELSPR